MSVSGIYNYHVKINNPGEVFHQMDSQQAPFYFGGSQVPINTNFMHGNGVKTPYKPTYTQMKKQQENDDRSTGSNRAVKTTHSKHNNIRIGSYLTRI